MNKLKKCTKALVLITGLCVAGWTIARIDVEILPTQNNDDTITYTVQARNTGSNPESVDLMLQWPVNDFQCTAITRVAGELEHTNEGMRWHGFSLKPNESLALGVRSMGRYDKEMSCFTASVSKKTARKAVIPVQELDIFMADDVCSDMPKVGPADPRADFVNVLAGGSIIIDVLSNDCDTPEAYIQTVTQPSYGTVTGSYPNPNVPLTYTQNLSLPGPLPLTDSFTYTVGCGASPEVWYVVTVYVTIVEPDSFIGTLMQGCPIPPGPTDFFADSTEPEELFELEFVADPEPEELVELVEPEPTEPADITESIEG